MVQGLPDRLKEMRAKYGFSQRAVADRLHVSSSVVAGYEQGNRTPSTEVLLRLADIYQCSTDYLLCRERDKHQIILNVDGLTNKQIEAISHLIEAFRQEQ